MTAATTSLVVLLLAAGTAPAQTLVPGPIDWRPVGPKKTVPEMPVIPEPAITPVQFKPVPPVGGPDKLPELKTLPGGKVGVPLGSRIQNAENEADIAIKTEPPGIDQLTNRWSEAQLHEALRMENDRTPGRSRIFFPEEEPVSKEPFAGRHSKPSIRLVEPYYVNHQPLLFEQKNWERYGWDVGAMSPVVELTNYFYDLVLLPYHLGADTCHSLDSSRGKCLPGDAVPLLLYPERFSVTGLVFEAGTIMGGLFAFP